MSNSTLLALLFLVTAGLVLAYAFWQRGKVSKAKSENHHSAMTEGHPEQRSAKGAPGVPPQR